MTGHAIKRLRESIPCYTQEQLARDIGYAVSTVSHWEQAAEKSVKPAVALAIRTACHRRRAHGGHHNGA